MSFKAVEWALAQHVDRSSAKFVLVAMASCVNVKTEEMVCFPSTAHLCAITSQDRKTVLANMRVLQDLGYIVPTGKRAGRTGQITIFMLNTPAFGATPERSNLPSNSTETGTVSNEGNSTEIGTVEESQKRNSTENGTVPFFPSNSAVFSIKESQISFERVPKTGHGTSKEQGKEPVRNKKEKSVGFNPASVELPDWLPIELWAMWVKYRAQSKKPVTEDAARLQIGKLAKFRSQGHDVRLVIEAVIENGWQGLFVPNDGSTKLRGSSMPMGNVSWLAQAGFEHIAEAQNARCHIGNYREFRNGKRIVEEAHA